MLNKLKMKICRSLIALGKRWNIDVSKEEQELDAIEQLWEGQK